ncbi:MAG: hypothetical protein CMO74_07270 [Verrucomicrobiales bacterium]|nr:hypothetical protein [Verrucomicrobiales bacterium]
MANPIRPACFILLFGTVAAMTAQKEPLFPEKLNTVIKPIGTDKSVKWDYDIVYVRALRAGDEAHKRFYTDFSAPITMEPGADLIRLRPDGSEEVLVRGGDGSITDPMVSFDGKWVYYTKIHYLKKASQWNPPAAGADIFKIHLETKRIVRLTNQQFAPNLGAGDWASDFRNTARKENRKHHFAYGVYNMGPCPLPNGRVVYTSNREGFKPSKGYPAVALQLFVMDDRDTDLPADERHPANLEKIGHLNIAGALHPVVLADGRIMFSTLESQGIRSRISWGIWTIHPDGSNWAPLVSAFDPGGAANGFHFQTQLSDGSLVIEEYYNQNNSGFGAYIKMPPQVTFSPAYRNDPRNPALRFGRHYNGKGKYYRMAFMPEQAVSLTPFALNGEGPADPSVLGDKKSPAVGKFTHPSGAPDNHLLTIYTPGPANHQYKYLPQIDGGIYLLKNGAAIDEPGDLLLIKNDPKYNESWPRAVVPYSRIYGMKEPKRLAPVANIGQAHPALPAGTPFGLVGSSSMYKRESYPNGIVPPGSVTSTYAGGRNPWRDLDAFTSHGNGMPRNWHNQGADAGLYDNADIHAIRVLAMEPTTDRQRGANNGRGFFSHAMERLRILAEIPVRKFRNGKQPTDPDGQPDTSFLAKIPADTAFTFQTLDRDGMVLNMSQTWHHLRPGEMRVDCGGCHAHSQKPTDFKLTLASKPDYKIWDLTETTPLLTDRARDESKTQWDTNTVGGLRTAKQPATTVEYFRDIQPILKTHCTVCHTKEWRKPAGNLVLDDDDNWINVPNRGKFPGTYFRLAVDERAKFGHQPIGYPSWGYPNASRYIRKLQSRRSLLTWKIYGRRLDGFSNDDHPSEPNPGIGHFEHHGKRVDTAHARARYDLDYIGSAMPPPAAIRGTFKSPGGKPIKVPPLTDEAKRTFTRWIDLGCPIDLNPKFGWHLDDNRPVLTLAEPAPNHAGPLSRLRIGMDDYGTGLNLETFTVTSSLKINSLAPGENLAPHFRKSTQGVWELPLNQPIPYRTHKTAHWTASIKDKQGNETKIVRILEVPPTPTTARK